MGDDDDREEEDDEEEEVDDSKDEDKIADDDDDVSIGITMLAVFSMNIILCEIGNIVEVFGKSV